METLSVDKNCEMLTAHILNRISAVQDGFKLYVQMFSAILGGAVVLRLQYGPMMPPYFAWLADALATLIFVNAVVTIYENARSWREFRKMLSDIAGVDMSGEKIIPPPKFLRATLSWRVMLGAMVFAQGLFYIFNPLRV